MHVYTCAADLVLVVCVYVCVQSRTDFASMVMELAAVSW